MASSKSSVGGWVGMFLAAVVAGVIAGFVVGAFSGGGGGAGPVGPTETDPELTEAEADENPYARFRVAEFRLTDQDGRPVRESLFDGEVTALTFFFTSCAGPCPEMTKAMASIQEKSARGPASGLRLASISVDGSRDTPEIVRAFAEGYGADFSRWTFLTGDPVAVRGLVTDSIGFDLREQAEVQVEGPGGVTMNNILHPTRILLVGPDRRVIGVYWYNDPEQIEKLVADAAAALG